jgi:translation initiation factor IF-1
MEDPNSNIGFVCSEHAPRADPIYATKAPKFFLRKYVKTAFEGQRPNGTKTLEHMWVKVECIEDGRLLGRLNNAPRLKMGLEVGDRVLVRLTDIEEVLTADAED